MNSDAVFWICAAIVLCTLIVCSTIENINGGEE